MQLPRWPNKKAVKSLFKGTVCCQVTTLRSATSVVERRPAFDWLAACIPVLHLQNKASVRSFRRPQKISQNIQQILSFTSRTTLLQLGCISCISVFRRATAKRVRGTGEYACKYQTPLDDVSIRILAQFHKVWQKTSHVTPLHTILPVASLSFTLRAK